MSDTLALIAMACRLPGAPDTQTFWQNLIQGCDLLQEIPLTRWDARPYHDPRPGRGRGGKCSTTKGYFLDDVRGFDAGFFKIAPEDAAVMDPQQRILLELSFEAFAAAGYSREALSGQKVGVFMGITKSDYQNNIAEALARGELQQKTVVTGILENLIAARIAHYFDLTGPALTLDTACSSSLVALHMASNSIRAGDCDMALIGGINLNLNPPAFLGMSAAQALSAGEHYHVFDQRASGFFMGEGGGVVLLKKHDQALADQNPILGLLLGSAVNNDGRSISPMAPRSSTQQAVIRQACAVAGIDPDQISLIEAHGTGTALGDAMEAQTLNAIFAGQKTRPVLGSVKPNVGHLLSAAGMASLIKTLLCFQHRQIPPLLHYAEPRAELQLEAQGFCLNRSLLQVPEGQVMLAGINAFGFGGTNAHVLLQAAQNRVTDPPFCQPRPAYQKREYWVGLQPAQRAAALVADKPQAPLPAAVRSFETRWLAQPLPEPVAQPVAAPLWLLADPLQSAAQQQLQAALQQAGHTCHCLSDAESLAVVSASLPASMRLIWLLPLSAPALYAGLQALARSPLLARCQDLSVITCAGLPLAADGSALPADAAATDALRQSGLLWGASSELGLPLQQLDLLPADFADQLPALLRCLMQPPAQPGETRQWALRNRQIGQNGQTGPFWQIWQRSQRAVSLALQPPPPPRIRPGGVYLISGGASGLGALLAESLAHRQPHTGLQLVAVGRRVAAAVPGLADLQQRIQAQGATLSYYRVDMGQPAEVQALCRQLQQQHGQLHGVVHAAGQVQLRDLRRTAYTERLALMAPKVEGLVALHQALLALPQPPDFLVAFSSLSAALPGYGRGLIDYVAANHFMDLYASAQQDAALPVQVIQWGPWQGSGMADHPLLRQQLAAQGIESLQPAEGLAAFEALIDGGFAQALVLKSTRELAGLRAQLSASALQRPPGAQSLSPAGATEAFAEAIAEAPAASAPHMPAPHTPALKDLTLPAGPQRESPALSGSTPDALAALEQRLQHLIQGVLDQNGSTVSVGPEDNLMDLGLDSLSAIELTQTLEDWGFTQLPFELFFEQQHIRALAQYLLARQPAAPLSTPLAASFSASLAPPGETSLMEPLDTPLAAASPAAEPAPGGTADSLSSAARADVAAPALSATVTAPALSPLSPVQQGFYLAHHLSERPNYSYFRLSLQRPLNPELLNRALWALLARHGQLRAVFKQQLGPDGLQLGYQELSLAQLQNQLRARGVAGAEPELVVLLPADQDLAATEEAFVNQRFELTQAPLFCIGLQQSPAASHLLLLFHHIVFDGVSMHQLLQALWSAYRALETGQPLPASEAPATGYADYVQQVQAYRRSPEGEAALQQWAAVLARGAAPEGPFLRALAARHAALGKVPAASRQYPVPAATGAALRQLATARQTPLQMICLSAFYRALGQWTREYRLWVQLASAGRHWPLPQMHKVIGSFAELFPLYADLNQYPAQDLALARALRQQWNAQQPLQRAGADQVSRLAREHGLSLPFSFSFAHFDFDWMPAADQAQVLSTRMQGFHGQTQLGLLVSENHQGFYYALNSPAGLFEPESLATLASLFEAELVALAKLVAPAASSESAESLPAAVPEAEPPAVSDEPASAAPSEPAADPVPDPVPDFWQVFQAAPDQAPALQTPEQTLSYAALRQQVARLAHELAARGLRPGSTLVFQGEATSQSLCLLLACLASGVVWVPVDSAAPPQRLQAISAQLQPDLLVRQQPGSPESEGESEGLALAALLQAADNRPACFQSPPRAAEDLAYILFTSGSTGTPKGVPILYSALMRYLGWALQHFDYGPQDRVLLTASLAFDACLRPLLAPLMSGGCVCLPGTEILRDPLALLQWLRAARITVWSSVPGLWQVLIQALETENKTRPAGEDPLPDLRLVQLGGEVLPAGLLTRWRALMGTARPLFNLYGPTETTINVTACRIPVTHPADQPVPLGRPLPYLQVQVMLPTGQPCAPGEAGELWVSGPTLTPGYLQTGATADLNATFVRYAGQRYYRTGDRVSEDAQGLLHYHGRIDRQLKLRGYRLEPGEIEALLLACAGVSAAWVDALPGPGGALLLVAAVSGQDPLDPVALQQHLARCLPDYLLPSRIFCLAGLARLPNGKLDPAAIRQQLLQAMAHEETERQVDPQSDPPREVPAAEASQDIAERVRAVWQSLLQRQQIPPEADFFQLGGDSLLLMQAYLQLQQPGLQLPPMARFYSQRRWRDWVALLHTAAADTRSEHSTGPASEYAGAVKGQPFGLSPGQMGFYLWHQHLAHDSSCWAAELLLHGPLEPERFEQALMLAARRHEMLCVRLQAGNPPRFVPQSEPQLHFVYAEQGPETLPAPPPLQMLSGPLLQSQLIRQAPERHLWRIQAHHILADGLSCVILGRDLLAAYRHLEQPDAVPLPAPLRAQFSDHIARLAQQAPAEADAHLDYWRGVFASPYIPPLLRGRSAPPEAAPEFLTLTQALPLRALAALEQQCQAAGCTLFMGFLAAYQQGLIALTGQQDLVVGVAHHGRDTALPDIAAIFGCFAHTLPLRLPPPAGDARQQLQALQQAYQQALNHPPDPLRLLRSLSPTPRLATVLGTQFFISTLDLNPLLADEALSPCPWRFDLAASQTHFQPANQDTDLFLALKQQGDQLVLSLMVHTAACTAAEAEALLDQLVNHLTAAPDPDALPARPESAALTAEAFSDSLTEPLTDFAASPVSASQAFGLRRQPFELAETGPLDAALISYLPAVDQLAQLLPELGLAQTEVLRQRLFPAGQAHWLEYLQTPLGRAANLVLPFFAHEIQPGQAPRILPAIQQAREQARALGARVVSLAGLLPAVSAYGLNLPADLPQRLSTGHSTTVAAMLHTTVFALAQTGRPLADCHLALVGLGSIGEASLLALLASQPHPARLTLVDRPGSARRLQQLAQRLAGRHAYKGPVEILLSADAAPPAVYRADLMLAAVSARQVLDIQQLRPGTLLIDDSFPHCFDVGAAIARMQQQRDVLVLGGGLLRLPACERQLHLPLPQLALQRALAGVVLPACLPGCQLESLLLAAHPELPETLGLVASEKLLYYLPVLQAAGIQAAPLHLTAYQIPPELPAAVQAAWVASRL